MENGLTYTELERIEDAIGARIAKHERDHEGLYTPKALKTLRPIWRTDIIKQIVQGTA